MGFGLSNDTMLERNLLLSGQAAVHGFFLFHIYLEEEN